VSDVELIEISKAFGAVPVVDGVNVRIREGEFFSLLGPSGCGKTTTLRMIAGFTRPNAGRIKIGGDDVTFLPPEKRDVGIVFQNYAIFPHLNVSDNIAFGLKLRKRSKAEISASIRDVLRQVGLVNYDKRFQRELSGGEQQRVALARVLVTQPRILLLDEPLSALDKNLREEMKYWIKSLQKSLGITTIYVTHDQGEALTMSDRIAVMNKGRIAQVGTPKEIYETPASLFVTTFIGESNLLNVVVKHMSNDMAVIDLEGTELRSRVRTPVPPGATAKLILRPENVLMGEPVAHKGFVCVEAVVLEEIYKGAQLRYRLSIGGQELFCEVQNQTNSRGPASGARVRVGWDPNNSELLMV
jgi:putative spermidine/putrescine transport system ATP-binding protein